MFEKKNRRTLMYLLELIFLRKLRFDDDPKNGWSFKQAWPCMADGDAAKVLFMLVLFPVKVPLNLDFK